MTSSETGPDTGPGADAWFTPWRFAALLGLLIAACFPNVISGLESFYYRDFAMFGYPLAVHHKEAFWRGEMPLWNPYNDCGLPFMAQWNTLTLYPLSLVYLLLPLPWSLNLFCLGHLFLAGMGAYFLGRHWTGNRFAAAVAGIGFAYSGLTWHALMWPNDIAAFGWMPWVVLTVERAWREGGRQIIVAGLAGAMQMLSGAPEVILFTWFMAGAFWVVEFLVGDLSRGRLVSRTAGAGLLVAGLASAQLLPFLDLLAHSHRDNSYSDAQWAMPGSGWANYLVPLFHCVRASRGVPMQHDQYWTSSYFVGVGVLALALLAVWRVHNRRVWLLAALALLSMLMAMGNNGPVYAVLRKVVPQLGFMRFPIKFVMVASFALPFLAAHGVAWLRGLATEQWPGEWKRLRWLGLILIGMIGVIVVMAWRFPQSNDDVQATALNGLRGGLFLAAMLACIAALQRAVEVKRLVIFQAALLVLFWMDVYTHVHTLSPTAPPGVLATGSIRQYLVGQNYLQSDSELKLGGSRAMQTLASLRKMYFGGQENPVDDVLGRRAQLYDDLNLLDRIPKLDGFYSLYLHEMNAVITGLYTSSNDVTRLKDFLGVSHESLSTNVMEWVGRKSYAPLITAGQQPMFVDDENALGALFETNFDGRKLVLLPPEAKAVVHAGACDNVQLSDLDVSANRITAHTTATAAAMLVIAQAYYHPWHAYVDGKPTPLWRANYAFQALEVPAGNHRVQVVYEDSRFRTGCVISAAALLGCAGFWIQSRKKAAAKG